MKDKYNTKKDNLNEQMVGIADDASESYNRQLAIGSGEQELKKLRLVKDAKKMDDGQYGICSACQESVPEVR